MRDLKNCLVCGGGKLETLHESTFAGEWHDAIPLFLTEREYAVNGRILCCRSCGFSFTSPQFDIIEYASIYEALATSAVSDFLGKAECIRFKRLARRVRQHIPQGTFLDLGCGSGWFHQHFGNKDSVGFEISKSDQFNFDSANQIFKGSFPEFARGSASRANFDYVTAWDVVEHIADLDSVISGLRAVLKPGGWFFCSLPDASSWSAKFSGRKWNCLLLEHLWYFNPETLGMYLEKFGFERVEISKLWYPAEISTIASRLAQTYHIPAVRLPRVIGQRVINLPIGLMFGAFRRIG